MFVCFLQLHLYLACCKDEEGGCATAVVVAVLFLEFQIKRKIMEECTVHLSYGTPVFKNKVVLLLFIAESSDPSVKRKYSTDLSIKLRP